MTTPYRIFLAISMSSLFFPFASQGQTTNINGAVGGPPATTMLAGSLSSMPFSCAAGAHYYASDQAVGSQFYECSPATGTYKLITCDANHRGDVWFANGALSGDSYLTCVFDSSQYKLVGINDLTVGNIFSSSEPGLVPSSGGDPTKFLSADGTFKVPSGGGSYASIPIAGGVNATPYAWSQKPNTALTAGAPTTISLASCPAGVNGSDPNLWLYISGGSGTAEAVRVAGGTCISGGSGTLTFTPANSHSGAWEISSATAGIYEAVAANPGRKIYVPSGDYAMHACMTLNGAGAHGFYIYGDSSPRSSPGGSDLDFSGITTGCDGITIQNVGNSQVILQDIQMWGSDNLTGTGNGLTLNDGDANDLVHVSLHGLVIQQFSKSGVYANQSYELLIDDHSMIEGNGFWGVDLEGQTNLTAVKDSILGGNSAAGNYGGMIENGQSSATTNSNLLIENTDFGEQGTMPFNGATVTDATGLIVNNISGVTLMNNWFENEVGYAHAITYGAAVQSITEVSNYVEDGAITYNAGTANIYSHQNTFDKWHTAGSRVIPNVTSFWSTANWIFGPDNNLGGGNIGISDTAASGEIWHHFGYYDYNKTGNIGPDTLTCFGGQSICAEGLYRLSVYMFTQSTATAGSAKFSLSYTDHQGLKTVFGPTLGLPANLDLTSANGLTSGVAVFNLSGASDPTYSITLSNVTGSPKFGYELIFEKLQ